MWTGRWLLAAIAVCFRLQRDPAVRGTWRSRQAAPGGLKLRRKSEYFWTVSLAFLPVQSD